MAYIESEWPLTFLQLRQSSFADLCFTTYLIPIPTCFQSLSRPQAVSGAPGGGEERLPRPTLQRARSRSLIDLDQPNKGVRIIM